VIYTCLILATSTLLIDVILVWSHGIYEMKARSILLAWLQFQAFPTVEQFLKKHE